MNQDFPPQSERTVNKEEKYPSNETDKKCDLKV